MNTWWYIHTVTLNQLSCRWIRDDIYIPQLYINFPADEHLMIYAYGNFISTFLQMNTLWYMHTATLYQLSCRWTPDDIYIPQLYINFLADEHLMIYTYRNFISTLLQMNTWWYIHTVSLYQHFWTRTREDIYIPQLYINFRYNTWFYIQIATFFQLPCRWTCVDIFMLQLYIIFFMNTWW